MNFKKAKMHSSRNERGRIILLVLVTIFALSAFWFIALGVTGSELRIVGGKKSSAQSFFDAEAGLNAAMENFESLYNTLSVAGNPLTALAQLQPVDQTAGNREVADVYCQIVHQNTTVPYASESYNPPFQAHEFRPPAGSGSGVNTAVARRYVITSKAKTGEKIVQAGVYWVVPK